MPGCLCVQGNKIVLRTRSAPCPRTPDGRRMNSCCPLPLLLLLLLPWLPALVHGSADSPPLLQVQFYECLDVPLVCQDCPGPPDPSVARTKITLGYLTAVTGTMNNRQVGGSGLCQAHWVHLLSFVTLQYFVAFISIKWPLVQLDCFVFSLLSLVPAVSMGLLCCILIPLVSVFILINFL